MKINTRAKMQRTNAKIKELLLSKGFSNMYLFPHMRHMKDYILDDEGFDALATKNGCIFLLQFKTNNKCTKKTKGKYIELSKKYNIGFVWCSYFDKKKRAKRNPQEFDYFEVINDKKSVCPKDFHLVSAFHRSDNDVFGTHIKGKSLL